MNSNDKQHYIYLRGINERVSVTKQEFDDYYRDTCRITRHNMIAFLQENAVYSMKETLKESTAEIHLFVGEKENKNILHSAEKIHAVMKNSTVHVLRGLYHGEFSINFPQRFVDELKTIVHHQS